GRTTTRDEHAEEQDALRCEEALQDHWERQVAAPADQRAPLPRAQAEPPHPPPGPGPGRRPRRRQEDQEAARQVTPPPTEGEKTWHASSGRSTPRRSAAPPWTAPPATGASVRGCTARPRSR